MSESKEPPFLICFLSQIFENEEILCLDLEEICFPSLIQNWNKKKGQVLFSNPNGSSVSKSYLKGGKTPFNLAQCS